MKLTSLIKNEKYFERWDQQTQEQEKIENLDN